MLSYQHAYHAGNLADVHKHAVLARALDYLTRKDKPLTYMETHAGRAIYDLAGPEALKTGEAAIGIARAAGWFPPAHPYARALAATRAALGPAAYPGSPAIAAQLLRPADRIILAELHPAEHRALRAGLQAAPGGATVEVHRRDGVEMALALTPPMPRRGLILIDPAYEVKADYQGMADLVPKLHRRWNVGVILLWYPILTDGPHGPMRDAVRAALPAAVVHEVRFPPARPGHRMVGSGLFIVNPPYGLEDELRYLSMQYDLF
jgi:23S rRNA (adenine2030-N6)-methyltransferase